MEFAFSFMTGTSTLALYGEGTLDDRLQDDPDWWAHGWSELPEIQARRLCLFELGADGSYGIHVVSEPHSEDLLDRSVARVQGQGFSAPGGKVYIGAADCLPADDLRPDDSVKAYGQFIEVPAGDYLVDALRLPRLPPPGGAEPRGPELVLRVFPRGQEERAAPDAFRLTQAWGP